jgi:hypothetical protein
MISKFGTHAIYMLFNEFASITTETGKTVNLQRKIYKEIGYYVDMTTNEIYLPRDGEEMIGKWDPIKNRPIDQYGEIRATMLDYETEKLDEELDLLDCYQANGTSNF